MALKKFDATNSGYRTGEPMISFNNAGVVRLTKDAVLALGLKARDKVSLVQDDEEERDWFLKIHDKNGFITRLNGGADDAVSLCFNCSFLTKKILDIAEVEKNVNCKLITNATEIDGENYYPIIIPKP